MTAFLADRIRHFEGLDYGFFGVDDDGHVDAMTLRDAYLDAGRDEDARLQELRLKYRRRTDPATQVVTGEPPYRVLDNGDVQIPFAPLYRPVWQAMSVAGTRAGLCLSHAGEVRIHAGFYNRTDWAGEPLVNRTLALLSGLRHETLEQYNGGEGLCGRYLWPYDAVSAEDLGIARRLVSEAESLVREWRDFLAANPVSYGWPTFAEGGGPGLFEEWDGPTHGAAEELGRLVPTIPASFSRFGS